MTVVSVRCFLLVQLLYELQIFVALSVTAGVRMNRLYFIEISKYQTKISYNYQLSK